MDKISAHDKQVLNRIFHPEMPDLHDEDDAEGVETESDPYPPQDMAIIKASQVKAIQLADEERYEESMEMLSHTIDQYPGVAALYNDRAQVHQLHGHQEEAMKDLEEAVRLSHEKGSVAAKALTQMGMLLRLKGQDEKARDVFTRAAHLGNPFAKQMIVQMNPYAALCNNMLTQMIRELMAPKCVSEDAPS